jgi:hypothetical protein
MSITAKLLASVAALTGLVLTAVLPAASAESAAGTYRVTLVNLTHGQPFSPPVAATHQKSIRMFQVGGLASDELAAIAQDGNEAPMVDLFNASGKVTEVVDVGRPVTAHGTTVGSFTDSAAFEIRAAAGDRLSLSTMLICTNDGFLGLDAVKLPKHGSETFSVNGYDAGREQNTERSEDLVDPCSALNPSFPLAGDPDGNADAAVATVPAEPIHHHPGIAGVGDLSAANHGWIDPVATVTVERIS